MGGSRPGVIWSEIDATQKKKVIIILFILLIAFGVIGYWAVSFLPMPLNP